MDMQTKITFKYKNYSKSMYWEEPISISVDKLTPDDKKIERET